MRIALDVMGGDHAPGPIIQGAVKAVAEIPGLEIALVGDSSKILSHLKLDNPGDLHPGLQIQHCTQVVNMDEKPAFALRRKRDSSIARCWELMAERTVDAIVSAGNTGATVAHGFMTRLFLKEVLRPALSVVFPSVTGPSVLLDVGANTNAKPEHLYQYGVMGAIYAENMLKIHNPSVALMNVGSEQGKGNDLVRETAKLFEHSPLSSQFTGNVEGRDLHQGTANVVVCDGFVGNVVLKASEGLVELFLKTAAQEVLQKVQHEQAAVREAFKDLVRRYDYSEYGGAPLLGIDGICIVCHGSSGPRAIFKAIEVAANFANDGLNKHIVERLQMTPKTTAISSSP